MSEEKEEESSVKEEPEDAEVEEEDVERMERGDEKKEEAAEEEEQELVNIRIPTQTKKSLKRKHIRTDFGAADLEADVSEAQRLEKQRLERLEKIKPENDHIQQIESLFLSGAGESALPQLDIDDDDFEQMFGFNVESDNKRFRDKFENEQKPDAYFLNQPLHHLPSTSRGPVDVVDLTMDDSDDDCMITDIKSVIPASVPGRRMRWAQAEKDRIDADQMEIQHNVEARRLQKMRSAKDLESTEKKGGRLLVNAGHPEEDPDIFVIAHLTHVLQPHQLGGIRFMYDNTIESLSEYKRSDGFGCILAHSMGLGKTIQVITFSEIFLRATKAKKVLIIVPINTIQNWYAEYDKWIPKFSDTGDRIRNFEVFLLGDGVKTFDQRVNLIEEWDQKGGILLIGYDMFRLLIKMTMPKKAKKGRPKLNLFGISSGSSRGDQYDDAQAREEEMEFETGFTNGGRVRQEAYSLIRHALLEPGPDLVVCDEGHKIKNITAEISTTLGAIVTKRRIVLTGYPLQNNLMEYFCMIDFVRPKYLGVRKSFIERFEKPIKNGQCVDSSPADVKLALQRTHVLVELVKGFVQRRTHHLLKRILPESKEYVLLLRKSQIQRQLYRNFVLWAKAEIAANNDSVFNPLMAFSACSKIWNHPDILFKVVEQKRKNEEEKRRLEYQKFQLQQQKQQQQQQLQQQQQQHGMMMMMGHNGMMPGFGAQFPPQQLPNGMNGMNGMMMSNNPWQHNHHQNNYQIPSPFTISSSPSTPTTSSGTPKPGSKKQRKQRTTKKSAGRSDEEDEGDEKESRMKYDWTFELFEKYQEGVLENGYKIVVSLEILDESTRIGEKILIFSQNLTALDMLEEILRKRQIAEKDDKYGERWEKNRNYLRLDGTTSGADREKLINRFNSEPGLRLFLISTRAGSLGINLVSANRCIIIDACWNPCHDAQAVCRVYRYGQQKKTFVYRLIMDNSMERSIFNRQISKHGLQQRVVDDAQVDANISQKELETLLMYDEAQDVKHDKWDTNDWDFGDTVLDTITKKMSQMFSQKPFLHETLIMESEQSLSEQEKREAQLLFERERRMENYDPSSLGSSNFYNNMPGSSSMMPMYNNNNFNTWPNPPPPQQQQQFQTNFQQPPYPNQSPFPQPSPFPNNIAPPRPTPTPHTLRLNVGQFHQQGGHTMTSYNNGYVNNNSMGSQHQMLAPIDPSAFPGACMSRKPVFSAAGVIQYVVTDRGWYRKKHLKNYNFGNLQHSFSQSLVFVSNCARCQ
ncbi:hypothetical protein CAEBREN_01708 [Caenorhabditis brenneri]|uniref:Uncharacterized protein n=1 Tax=Caenorhabditis brenneri TaxID=135651 RepID=G0NWY8_CAEBE|nr:hypothetical protein CAEBREN_01708 [Caenorhabditis brenneri]